MATERQSAAQVGQGDWVYASRDLHILQLFLFTKDSPHFRVLVKLLSHYYSCLGGYF